MNNFYYYFFYSVAIFARRINKRDKDYTFTSLIFVSLCIGLNGLSVIFLMDRFVSVSFDIKESILILAAIVFGVNYFLLMKGGKDVEIIEFYDNKQKSGKPVFWKRVFVVSYIVLSYSLCIVAAYLTKKA